MVVVSQSHGPQRTVWISTKYRFSIMSLNANHQRVLAAAVFAGGVIVLLRSCWLAKPPQGRVVEEPPAPVALKSIDFSAASTDPEALPGIFEQLHALVIERSQGVPLLTRLGDQARTDLADAFVERLRFMLSPEPERDYESFASRGDPRDYSEWSSNFEKFIAYQNSQTEFPGIDPDGLQVVQLTVNARGEQDQRLTRFQEGYQAQIGSGVGLPSIPKDPVDAGLPVVEVIVPIERMDMRKKQLLPAIQGYHFVWIAKRGVWVPYESVVYCARGSAFGTPPI